jgi:DNA (cytosine-5)-methyltransferase 1
MLKRNALSSYNDKPLIISLFSGAGGLDLGFREEGYQIVLAIDSEPSAIETHEHNFSSTKAVVADLSKIGPSGVLKWVSETVSLGSKIGIIGGPPCQGFSRANIAPKPNDPRNLLPILYIEIIREIQRYYSVEFVIFENVMGMKDKKHSGKYFELVEGLKSLHFDLNEQELCAFDFGVPQNRHRIIITALKSGQGYTKVAPERKVGKLTVRDAIGDLVEPAFFERTLKKADIPLHPNHWTMKPKSYRFYQDFDENNKTRSFRKLNWDKASPTIAFGNREIHVHPNGRRRLSIYEAMLLQGFPSSFELKGNLSQQVQQISNAVPPPLAKSLAAALTQSMRKDN